MISVEQAGLLSLEYNVIPLVEKLFGIADSPLALYTKLCGERPNTFLLESAEQGVWGRYSFIGIGARGTLSVKEGNSAWFSSYPALPKGELPLDPLDALKLMQSSWIAPTLDFPLSSGLVGFAAWEIVNQLERLEDQLDPGYEIPAMSFTQFDSLVVIDHKNSELSIVSLIFLDGESSIEEKYEQAKTRIADIKSLANQQSSQKLLTPNWPEPVLKPKNTKEQFLKSIESAKEYIKSGDVFQVVISQRFELESKTDAAQVYQTLRALNPSPYMYLTRWEDSHGSFAIVGSSPEALVKVSDGHVITHPIAGSRPRGADSKTDHQNAQELARDEKEKSEHLMLVDLARNDLLRVCEPSSLQVTEFMEIHRFSHIMHLVSTVEGNLRKGLTPVDVFRATFPAGTLSGAPKPRALEIIRELEPYGRGLFGGVVGYFDFSGNADLAIAIRTAVLRNGVAYVQAGAGIVLDSVPESEFEETKSKASAVLRAIAAANAMAGE